MKTTGRFILAAIFSLFFIAFAQAAPTQPNMQKARQYHEARMWQDAIEALNQVLKADPLNAEAHYRLGDSYAHGGDLYNAKERFKSAISLSLGQTGNVGKAIAYMNINQLLDARKVIDEGLKKRPAIRTKVASQIFDYGIDRLKDNQIDEATAIFDLAVHYDSDLSLKACDIFYGMASKLGDNAAVFYSTKVKSFCSNNPKRLEAMGEKLLEIASRQTGETKKQMKEMVLWFLPIERVNLVIAPPKWDKVYSKEFTGQGWGENDGIPTAEFGRDIAIGDRIIVTGNKFQVWDVGRWNDEEGKFETTNRSGRANAFGVKAEKGEKFSVIIERYSE